MPTQLDLFPDKQIIETRTVEVFPAIPLEAFKELARFSMFAELMERTETGAVIWDEQIDTVYSEEVFEAEWTALQKGWIKVRLEIPVDL